MQRTSVCAGTCMYAYSACERTPRGVKEWTGHGTNACAYPFAATACVCTRNGHAHSGGLETYYLRMYASAQVQPAPVGTAPSSRNRICVDNPQAGVRMRMVASGHAQMTGFGCVCGDKAMPTGTLDVDAYPRGNVG